MVVNTSLESGEDASAIIKGGNEEGGKGFVQLKSSIK